MFEPFLGEDSYAYSDSDESEEDDSSQSALKPQLDKGKGKLEETSEKPLTISIQAHESLKKSHKVNYKLAAQLRKPQWKWVPKQAKQDTQETTTHLEKPRHNPPLCQQQPYTTQQAKGSQSI